MPTLKPNGCPLWPPRLFAQTGVKLTSFANGQWGKKIRGGYYYFGKWAVPDPDDAAARAAIADYRRRANAIDAGNDNLPTTPGEITVDEVVNRFLGAKFEAVKSGELSARTFADYQAVGAFLVDHFGRHVSVDALTSDHFRGLRAKMPWGSTRTNNAIVWVRSIFNWADKERLIDRLPHYGASFATLPLKVRRKAKRDRGPRMFTADEVASLVAVASQPLKAMILLGINAGFGNTDCAELPLTVAREATATGVLTFPRPKTGSERQAPLWPETVTELTAALNARPKSPSKAVDALAFLTQTGLPWVAVRIGEDEEGKPDVTRTDAVASEFGPLCETAGVRRLGFYALRHTSKTLADELEMPHAANRLFGHELAGMSAVYNERIPVANLRKLTDHIRHWYLGGKVTKSEQVKQSDDKTGDGDGDQAGDAGPDSAGH